ncbi:MAG: pseudaminic acid cytidylyltransferase [Chlorobi bacterium]|nr:pseudaminic acid cytidylyltransferase [Chlorobiota bacterium]
MKKIAIIPARGGSKRIPRKNIKDFLGKPIIAYSIEAALGSGLFDEVMVSTDDEEIASVARRYGAGVPFMRSARTADDYATLADVTAEVLERYSRDQNRKFDYVAVLLPTAPFVDAADLRQSFEKLTASDADGLFPVVPFPAPVQRALHFQGDKIKMMHPENLNKRSQDLSPAYYDAGQYYWIKYDTFVRERKLWTDNVTAVVISPLKAQDIDTPEDWKLAELKYKLLKDERQ